MKIPDPNTLAIKAFAILLIASVVMFGGCRWQARLDAGAIVNAKAETVAAGHQLEAAARALSVASGQFKDIDKQTAANAAAAAKREQAVDAANETALDEAERWRNRRRELEAQAARDADACPVGLSRICGEPLR